MSRRPLYIDDVLECFDDHLDNVHNSIEGMLPSEILFELNPTRYYELLAVYIDEHYGTYKNAEETMYINNEEDE